MKVLLYLEAENYLRKSGIGRAIKHQEKALKMVNQSYTTDINDTYDLIHMNTYGYNSWKLMKEAQKKGKKVIMHGHSTEEDFRDSFIFSNLVSPLFKWYLCQFYKKADAIITPTEYSKTLIENYGIKTPIFVCSNGIDLKKYGKNPKKETAFRNYFNIKDNEKVIMCAGLYFKRKGIEDFVKVAEKLPNVRFIWFGETNKWVVPHSVRNIVTKNHPPNVTFAGYIKGDVFEGAMTASDAFFFPSKEETEGIVVLEALASKQKTILRDIPVYDSWINENAVEFGKNVPEFVAAIQRVLDGKSHKEDEGYKVAETKSIDKIGQRLVSIYEKVMALK